MIFRLLILIIHNHDRMPSITRVLRATTWHYFVSRLPGRFRRSSNVVKEAIMTDINDLVDDFWGTPSYGVVGASFYAMRRLFDILQGCLDHLEVCFDIVSAFPTASNLLIKSTDVGNLFPSLFPGPLFCTIGPRRQN